MPSSKGLAGTKTAWLFSTVQVPGTSSLSSSTTTPLASVEASSMAVAASINVRSMESSVRFSTEPSAGMDDTSSGAVVSRTISVLMVPLTSPLSFWAYTVRELFPSDRDNV